MALKTCESNKKTRYGTKKPALKTHESKKSTRYDTGLALKTLPTL
jgi:hypothetical protein